MQELQRKSSAAKLDLSQRQELANEALDRIHEAQRWNTERQLGFVGVANPVGPLTTSMVGSVVDWVKPRDNTLLGAVGAAGRAIPGAVGIMVGTFPMVAADSVRTAWRTAQYEAGWAPPGAYLSNAGVNQLSSMADRLTGPQR